MTNRFKAALAATSLAGAIIATGAAFDVDGFEVDIVQNQAVAEIVSGAVANAKPVEPSIVIAKMLDKSDGPGGDGHGEGGGGRNAGNNSDSRNGAGGQY